MSDCLTSLRETGYQAFLSGEAQSANPHERRQEWRNWRAWDEGWLASQNDNSTTGN